MEQRAPGSSAFQTSWDTNLEIRVCAGQKGEAGRESHSICYFAKIVPEWLSAAQNDSGLTATDGTSVVR